MSLIAPSEAASISLASKTIDVSSADQPPAGRYRGCGSDRAAIEELTDARDRHAKYAGGVTCRDEIFVHAAIMGAARRKIEIGKIDLAGIISPPFLPLPDKRIGRHRTIEAKD